MATSEKPLSERIKVRSVRMYGVVTTTATLNGPNGFEFSVRTDNGEPCELRAFAAEQRRRAQRLLTEAERAEAMADVVSTQKCKNATNPRKRD